MPAADAQTLSNKSGCLTFKDGATKFFIMTYHQPNSRFRSPADLNRRDREHFEVARSLGPNFTRAEFLNQYAKLYPKRTCGSIIPSDYCFNRENKGNRLHPRFLIWHSGSTYSFVGLRGELADPANSANRPAKFSDSAAGRARFVQAIQNRQQTSSAPESIDLTRLWARIQARLDAQMPDWRRRIDDLGQVNAVRERKVGRRWTDAEVFKALLAAVLSAVTDWSKVESLLRSPQMRTRFVGYDFCAFTAVSDVEIEDLVRWLEEHGAGSQNRRDSLRRLRQSACRLFEWSKEHGSAESYFRAAVGQPDGDPKLAALKLGGGSGRWKLPGLGVALAAEVLRNLGFDLAKPDRHVSRSFGAFGLVRFRNWKDRSGRHAPEATERETLDVMTAAEQLSTAAQELVCFVDNAVWLLCAKSGLHLTNEELTDLALQDCAGA